MRPPIPSAVLAGRPLGPAKMRKLEDGFFSISGAATPTFLDHSREHCPPWNPRRINKFQARNPFQLPLLHPSSRWPKSPQCESQHIVSAESTT